jgi:hypothetical protein
LILRINLQVYQQKIDQGISKHSQLHFSELILEWLSSGMPYKIPTFEEVKKNKLRVKVLKSAEHEDEKEKEVELDDIKKMTYTISELAVLRNFKIQMTNNESPKLYIDSSVIIEFISILRMVLNQTEDEKTCSLVHQALYAIYLKSKFNQTEETMLYISSVLNVL